VDDLAASRAPIRVGTAGWSYKDWEGTFYPGRGAGRFDALAFSASLFDTTEINSTFYRIPPPGMTRSWARRVADNPRFSFAAKLYRGFTHERNAGAAEQKAFVEAMTPLEEAGRLGAILVQLPFSFHREPTAVEYLGGLLVRFAQYPLAVEFRHDSWNDQETVQGLAGRGVAFVNIDQPQISRNLPATNYLTAPIAYYRFHGRNAGKWFGETSNQERYDYLYSDQELEPWVERVKTAQARLAGSEAEAGAAKPRRERGIYAIFNNHFRGQAPANALLFRKRVTGTEIAPPAELRRAYPALFGAPTEDQPRLF
jgi:uncharacterized protein YecE (DUF72 family)